MLDFGYLINKVAELLRGTVKVTSTQSSILLQLVDLSFDSLRKTYTFPILKCHAIPQREMQVESGMDYVYHVRAVNFIGVGPVSQILV